jgi:transcription elongation factor GreA
MEKLQAELDHLRTEGRRHAAQRLKQAIELGDLRESGEYEDAKRNQAFIEGRIQELEVLLADVVLLEEGNGGDVVALGTTVRIRDEEGYEESWTIVTEAESSPRDGRISDVSPVGEALFGRSVNDTVEVETPDGLTRLTILDIS